MKKLIVLALFIIGMSVQAQKFEDRSYKHEVVKFDDMQNYSYYRKLKNGRVKTYVAQNGDSFSVGDTLILGLPFGGGTHLRGGSNNNVTAERKFNASATSQRYSQIISGDPYNGGRIGLQVLAAAAGSTNVNWTTPLEGNFNGEVFIIKRIRVYRLKGGKKKKPYIGIAIQPLNGALGLNKNAFIRDYESALQIGELIDPNMIGRLTPDQARQELRLLKEDLELGILTRSEYEDKKREIISRIKK